VRGNFLLKGDGQRRKATREQTLDRTDRKKKIYMNVRIRRKLGTLFLLSFVYFGLTGLRKREVVVDVLFVTAAKRKVRVNPPTQRSGPQCEYTPNGLREKKQRKRKTWDRVEGEVRLETSTRIPTKKKHDVAEASPLHNAFATLKVPQTGKLES